METPKSDGFATEEIYKDALRQIAGIPPEGVNLSWLGNRCIMCTNIHSGGCTENEMRGRLMQVRSIALEALAAKPSIPLTREEGQSKTQEAFEGHQGVQE